jgi:hypothetical protein
MHRNLFPFASRATRSTTKRGFRRDGNVADGALGPITISRQSMTRYLHHARSPRERRSAAAAEGKGHPAFQRWTRLLAPWRAAIARWLVILRASPDG